MTIRTLVALVDGPEAARSALVAALALARRFDAHVEALHVRIDPKDAVPLLGEGMSGAMIEELIELTESESEARADAARGAFDEVRAAAGVEVADTPCAGPSVSWREDVGRDEEVVVGRGRLADLIVIGRPGPQAEPAATVALNAAIFESGRPVLLAPSPVPEAFGRRIAIAWNGSAEAARAVAAGLPLIAGADDVAILTTETERTPGTAAADLARYLSWHGVEARPRALPAGAGPAAAGLMDACAEERADLLVMGAYTHSRLRQLILGGVTRHVLETATLPVLMAH